MIFKQCDQLFSLIVEGLLFLILQFSPWSFLGGPFTVFAPTDEAFDRIPRDTLDEILQNKDLLSRILRRHVIIGRTLHARGISWDVHETSGSEMIATQVFKNGVIKVAANLDSSAFVQQTDLLATNGVIHVIDAVI